MTGTLLSIGHGYSARALANRLLSEGWRVIGTTRSGAKAKALKEDGIETLIWPGASLPFEEATHLLSSVPPADGGDPVLALAETELMQARHLSWVGYLSTTGVYGDHQGGWVDETTPTAPSTDRGRARVAAETGWQALGLPLHVFRLAGIYGPGRGPFEKILAGKARRIIRPGQVFGRIHVEDVATVLRASMLRPEPGAIYNVCDDDPSPPEDVIAFAAKLLGVPVPPAIPFDEAMLTPMARSFYAESKRVRNDRIKSELGVKLAFPDYRTGLRALLGT